MNPKPALTPAARDRYRRHLALPGFSETEQLRLADASVLMVGMGGLGCPAALYLAAAGVGRLVLADPDTVQVSNLQRQVLYRTNDVGRPKAICAAEALAALNPEVRVEPIVRAIAAESVMDLVGACDLVLDGSDNFPTRYLLNDACHFAGRPLVYGSVFRYEGQVSVFGFEGGPCLRCLYPAPPPAGMVPDCADGGVLGVLPGVVGATMATEAIKALAGIGDALAGRLLVYDALGGTWRALRFDRDPGCPLCGSEPTIRRLPPPQPEDPIQMNVTEFKSARDRGEALFLLDVREPYEVAISSIPGTDRVIPLGELVDHLDQLNPEDDIVVYCRAGGRSMNAVHILRHHGFARVRNLDGGLLAWARKIDPSIQTY